jgi:predicted nucleotidyltransferase
MFKNQLTMITHQNIPESVWTHLEKLAEHPRIEKMILFGSRAFGDHEERSDVDIAISGYQ